MLLFWKDHFTVMSLLPLPLIEREAEVYLVLIQTSFLLLWKSELKILVCIRITWINIIKQEGCIKTNVNSSLVCNRNCRLDYWQLVILNWSLDTCITYMHPIILLVIVYSTRELPPLCIVSIIAALAFVYLFEINRSCWRFSHINRQ